MKQPALKRRLIKALPVFLAVFWLSQPILDVLGYWQQKLGFPNYLTLAARFVLLAGTVLIGFLLSERRGCYLATGGVLAALTAAHILACLAQGYHDAVTDLVNLVRIYYLPLMTLCLITFFRLDRKLLKLSVICCVVNLALIGAVMLLSTMTDSDPHTYWMEKIGVLGWFLWANSQSAILSMLAPIAILWALRRWTDRVLPVVVVTLLSELPLFFLGTRLAFASMAATGVWIAAAGFVLLRGHRKQALAVLLVTLSLTAAYRLSPISDRQANAAAVDQNNVEKMDALELDGVELTKELLSEDPQLRIQLERYYNHYLRGMVQRFGFERVIAAYDYTLDPQQLGSRRLERITFCTMLMQDAGPLSRLFGLNLMDMREFLVNGFVNLETGEKVSGYKIYDVENDFHGVYFLTGWVGLGLMAFFLLWIGLRTVWRLVLDQKAVSLELAVAMLVYGFGMIYALLTVSVLRRNNAAVYFALALAGMYVLSDAKIPEADGREALHVGKNSC